MQMPGVGIVQAWAGASPLEYYLQIAWPDTGEVGWRAYEPNTLTLSDYRTAIINLPRGQGPQGLQIDFGGWVRGPRVSV